MSFKKETAAELTPAFACKAVARQANQGSDLQNILRQSYEYLTIMPMLRSTYDGRLIYKTSYGGR